jgi:NAD(P)-dependent dehydrogenase (short-subunit alcohol dehydrogenase family)
MRLSKRTAVITGGGGGIGLATARLFAAEGAQVIVVDVNAPPPDTPVDFLSSDVTDPAQIENVFQVIRDRYASLDLLILSAGRPYNSTSLQMSDADWEECLSLNLKAVWQYARAAHPLLSQSSCASIVTVASAHAFRSSQRSFAYSVAKGGVLSLTRSLAVEYAPHIRVNAIIPGQIESVRTEPFFASFRDAAEARRRVLSSFPMGRLGTPEDVAKAILFLASEDAAWITGSSLTVDGGRDAAMLNLTDLEQPE